MGQTVACRLRRAYACLTHPPRLGPTGLVLFSLQRDRVHDAGNAVTELARAGRRWRERRRCQPPAALHLGSAAAYGATATGSWRSFGQPVELHPQGRRAPPWRNRSWAELL